MWWIQSSSVGAEMETGQFSLMMCGATSFGPIRFHSSGLLNQQEADELVRVTEVSNTNAH